MKILQRIILFTICLAIVSGIFLITTIAHADPLTRTVSVTVRLNGVHGAGDFAATQAYNDGIYAGTLVRQDNTIRSVVRAYPTVSYSYQSDIQYPNDKPASGQSYFPLTVSSAYYDPLSGQSFTTTLWISGAPYFAGSVTTTTMYWTHYGYQYAPINHTKLGYMSNNTTTYYSGQYRFSNPPRQPSTYYGPPAEAGLGWVQYQQPVWDGDLQDAQQEPWRSICMDYNGVARFFSVTGGTANRYRKPVRIFYRRTASCQYIYQNYTGTATVMDTEITYTGTVSLKIPDLIFSSLTTDMLSYNANETITVTAVIKNQGLTGASASTARLTLGPHTVDKSVSALAAGATQTVTYAVTAPAYSTNTTLTATVTADALNAVTESNEANNSASRNVTIIAGLPDLTITGLTTNMVAYEVGETVTITATVRNQGDISASSFIVRLATSPATATQDRMISLAANASSTLTYTFVAPAVLDATSMTITVMADVTNIIVESNENNNTATKDIAINAMLPDLTVVSANTSDWYAGMEVLVSAKVSNLSAQPVPSAIIRLTAGGMTVNESIPVPGNGSNLAVFRFRVPASPGPLSVTITADPGNLINEINEANNSLMKNQAVVAVPPAVFSDPDDPVLEQVFLSRNKVLPALPSVTPSSYHTWQEIRLVNGSYVGRNYWAELKTTLSVAPDPRVERTQYSGVLESGFGIQQSCITTLSTNYDRPEKLIGTQIVWLFYPETAYGQAGHWLLCHEEMTSVGSVTGGNTSITWTYPVNPMSIKGSRLHFTPLWYPDGLYTVLAQGFYAWSPAGQMVAYDAESITVEGDMYDRIAVVRRK